MFGELIETGFAAAEEGAFIFVRSDQDVYGVLASLLEDCGQVFGYHPSIDDDAAPPLLLAVRSASAARPILCTYGLVIPGESCYTIARGR